MHSAPPVLVPVGRFVWGTRIAAGLALITLLASLVWLWQSQADANQVAAVLLGWLAMAALSAAVLRWQAGAPGQLRWDGEAWWFEAAETASAAQTVAVQPVWDLGSAMCLRLQAQGVPWRARSAYVWLRAQDLPRAWHALRCAVHQDHTL